MKTRNLAVNASLIASIFFSIQSKAQTLPDEINHPQYLKVYQNLQQVLSQKVEEYNKLNEQKTTLEKTIAQMEKDQVELPARNNELTKFISDARQKISQIDGEIQGLEGVLGKIIEDLRRLDNMLAQLQRDYSQESGRTQQIAARRNQIAQDVAQINARLQREINEENESIRNLERLTNDYNKAVIDRQEDQKEINQLGRQLDRFKVEVVQARNTVNQNNNALVTKRAQLADSQAKLPAATQERATEEAKLAQIDTTLNPKKAQLASLKEQLGRLSPDIARLQNENKALEQKIANNQSRIANVDALKARKEAIEKEISGTTTQVDQLSQKITDLQMSVRPQVLQVEELQKKYRQLVATRQMAEAMKVKAEIDALNAQLNPVQQEIQRTMAERERLSNSVSPRLAEIVTLRNQIAAAESNNAALQAEIDSSKNKIAENQKRIAELSASNAGLAQQIAELEAEVNSMSAQRDPLARRVAQLKQQELTLSSQVTTLAQEVKRLENEVQNLNERIAEMDKAIADYPQNVRRLENHMRQLDERIAPLRSQIDTEQRLQARIRQDRVQVQAERDRAQSVLDQVNQDLAQSDRLAGAIKSKLDQTAGERQALVKYNQDSISKLDNLKQDKSETESDIAAANEEIKVNNQDIQTIRAQLPKNKSDLAVLSPRVEAAQVAQTQAEQRVQDANVQYQNRLGLYQNYLSQAQKLGESKANIGTTDGQKAGSVEARAKANKIAGENASQEAKWEALRRGYVRGEISGYKTGFDLGMSSSADAERGNIEGQAAGARRAKDQANLVLKPEFYLEELARRLNEDEVQLKKMALQSIVQVVANTQSIAINGEPTIPDLSSSEIQEALRIVTSLDALIAQSDIEIDNVLNSRKKLAEPRNVYSTPGAGENANNADCSTVYKSVKDFLDACRGSYNLRYQGLYNTAHADSFRKDYPALFNEQIDRVFDSEIARLFPVYLSEATKVAKEVGVSTGKQEIYQQSFNRAEMSSYNSNLPNETARVETEAVQLVQKHLNNNAALTLKGSARISTADVNGIAPGIDAEVKMLIKNIGSVASSGNSIVKITSISNNASVDRGEAPLQSVAPKSETDLSVFRLKVSDAALPGSTLIIAGEITHPGNDYRSSRVETFRIEKVLAINPSIDATLEYDKSPKVNGLLGAKKHEVEITLKPKFAGTDKGYEAELTEVGTQFVQLTEKPKATEVLARGVAKKLKFEYKLNKAAKGQTVVMKLTIKNGGKIVSEQNLELKPE